MIDCVGPADRFATRRARWSCSARNGREIGPRPRHRRQRPGARFHRAGRRRRTSLKLYDAVYGGGPDYFYRLTVSAAPFVDFVFPPSGPAGSNNQFTLYGRNLPGGQPADGLLARRRAAAEVAGQHLRCRPTTRRKSQPGPRRARPAVGKPGRTAIEFRLPTPAGPANPVNGLFRRKRPVVDRAGAEQRAGHSDQDDASPANSPASSIRSATSIGCSSTPRRGRSTGSKRSRISSVSDSDPSFALFRVTKNDKGEEQVSDVAQVDDAAGAASSEIGSDFDTTTDDPSYKFTVPEDGTYRLMIRDQFGDGRKDPSYVYRLAIRPAEPDFRVLAYRRPCQWRSSDQNQMRRSLRRPFARAARTPVGVAVQRRDDFEGEITLSVEGLPRRRHLPGAVARRRCRARRRSSFALPRAPPPGPARSRSSRKAKIGDKERGPRSPLRAWSSGARPIASSSRRSSV